MILAISGKRGSGKSMLARFLQEHGYYQMSLADELKQRCLRDFPLLEHRHVYGKDKEQPTGYLRDNGSPLTGRDIMIRMGLFCRSIDSLYWCKLLWEKMVSLGHENYVIDDIRFMNEVKYFKGFGAKFIRIERLQELNCFKAALDDTSETELDAVREWDFKLEANENKTPEDLEKFAQYISDKVKLEAVKG